MGITTMHSPALSDAERAALQLIVDKADLVHVAGRAFLVLPIDAETIDTLAAVGVETEDMEPEPDCSYRAEDDDLPPPINVPGDDCDFEPDSYHGGQGANERATWFSINGQVYPGLYPDGRHGYSQGRATP